MEDTVVVSGDGQVETVTVDGTNIVAIDSENVDIVTVGIQGPQGIPGTPGTSGDKHYEQTFNTVSSVTVTHNLGKYPAVTVLDSADDEVIGDVQHQSVNQFTVTFTAPFSGLVICN